jgi:hypothetical protein
MVCARNKTGKRSGINMVAGSVGWTRAIDLTWIRWPKALLSGASSLTVSQARAVGQTSNIKQRQHSPFLCPTTRQPHGQADYERCWRHGRIAFKFPSGQHCEQVTRDKCRLPRCDGPRTGNRWRQAVPETTFQGRDVVAEAPTALSWLTMEDFSKA